MKSLLLLVCVNLLCGTALSQVVVHVASDGEDTPECVRENATYPCQTLEYVAQELEQVTNVKIKILINTDIYLQGTAIFQNLSNIAIIGEGNYGINCTCNGTENVSESCGVLFEGSSNIVIGNISIHDCSSRQDTLGDEYRYRSGIVFNGSTNITISNVNISNSYGYGAVITHATTGFIDISHSCFVNNSLNNNTLFYGGAGLLIYMTSCHLAEVACSLNQTAHIDIRIESSSFIGNTLEMVNYSSFWPLSYGGGLSIIFHWGTVGNTIKIIDTDFTGNRASSGGGAMVFCHEACYDNELLIERATFEANSHSKIPLGGNGLSLGLGTTEHGDSSGNNFTIVSSQFINNYGLYGSGTLVFVGAKYVIPSSASNIIAFINCTYSNNTAAIGAAVEVLPDFKGHLGKLFLATPVFDSCRFLSNHIKKQHLFGSQYPYSYYQAYGVFLVLKRSAAFKGHTVFENNNGSALFVSSSRVYFKQGASTIFNSNYANKGSAIAVIGASVIHSEEHTHYLFSNNYAILYGGAIYVLNIDEQVFITSHICFLVHDKPLSDGSAVNVTYRFDNNTAGSGLGNSIFLTSIDPCKHYCSKYYINDSTDKANPFHNGSCIGQFVYMNDSNQIATEAKAIKLTLAESSESLGVIPGHEYLLPIIAIDDLGQDVTKVTVYQSSMVSDAITIGPAFTFVANSTLTLYGEPGMRSNIVLSALGFHGTLGQIPVHLTACAPGYVLSSSKTNLTYCTCSTSANTTKHYNGITGCQEESGIAMAVSEFWVGYIIDDDTTEAGENNLYTSDCPAGCCMNFFNKGSSYLLVPKASKVELEERVCTANRHGIMCSLCKDGFSVYYHSPTAKCGDNSKCHLGVLFYIMSELFPITLLFVSILWFNISLTSGTAYSIIFMVQILQAMLITINGAVRFNLPILQDFYTMAYNSLNIDFFNIDELSFCLWTGAGTLDMLAMKYATVVFSMVLIGLFVFLINHCSSLIRKLHVHRRQSNAELSVVQGFTAFIVICYFQCARITFLLLNQITPKGIGGKPYSTVVFWAGHIKYFSIEHLKYAIPALLCLVVIVIPFPLILLLDGSLIKIESLLGARYRCINRIRPWTFLHIKVKPLLDSFQGCFKDRYRFFAGLFFIYRVIILLILDLSASAAEYYFFLEVSLVIVLTVQAIFQPFQKRHHNWIATGIFCNLAVINALTVRIYLVIKSDRNDSNGSEVVALQWIQLILIYIPLFVGVGWAVYKVYKCNKVERKVHQYVHSFSSRMSVTAEYDNIDDDNDFPEELFDRENN